METVRIRAFASIPKLFNKLVTLNMTLPSVLGFSEESFISGRYPGIFSKPNRTSFILELSPIFIHVWQHLLKLQMIIWPIMPMKLYQFRPPVVNGNII